ncbi:RNA methyltransferase [Peptococcaceae bacterium 1198_IL3148]
MEIQRNNPKIKYLRKLSRRQFRQKEGKFFIEGIRFVEELLQSGWPVDALFYTVKLTESPRGAELLAKAQQQNIDCWQIGADTLKEVTATDNPQGVLAQLAMPRHQLADMMCATIKPLVVLVDGVQDPGNLGTIIRTADAMGVSGVVLLKGTADLYNPKTLRATMGSIFHLPIIVAAEVDEVMDFLQANNIKLAVGDPHADVAVHEIDFTKPMAIVVGNEANGPTLTTVSRAEIKATIPMPGNAESLNAAVACSIMLYEAIRQRLVL